jgi:hypothetical protein
LPRPEDRDIEEEVVVGLCCCSREVLGEVVTGDEEMDGCGSTARGGLTAAGRVGLGAGVV